MTKVPKNWRLLALSDCATIERGRFSHRPRNAPEFYGGCIPFVQTGDVSNSGGVITAYSQTLNERGLSISKLFPKGTLLMTIAANIGDVAELGFDSACPDSLVAILPKDGLNSGYLRRYLEFLKARIHYLAPQNAQKNISVEFLEPLPVLLPPLPEQQKIAAILGAWDRAIEKLQALVMAKTERLRALRQQLLTGTRRFPEFRKERWTHVYLSDVVTHEPRLTTKPKGVFLAAGVRSHGKGVFLKPDFDAEDIALDELYELRTDDLVVNITFGWEGAVAIVPPEANGALVSHRFPTFVFRPSVSFPGYFRHVVRLRKFVFEVGLASPGGAGRNRVLSKKGFLRVPIDLPSLEEQQRIAAVLNACEREVRLVEAELGAVKQQKRGLMQELLTGEIRVKS
jgi:type I restriction enzyme S subunit